LTAQPTLSYAIDDQDHLIRLDEGYYRFAGESGWDGAGGNLGRSLWERRLELFAVGTCR
jgi:hypothetical protein